MKKLKIMKLEYGINRCRYALVKEYIKGTREETLYIVAELPFFEDDNDMKLRADLLGAFAYKNYFQALDVFVDRITRSS